MAMFSFGRKQQEEEEIPPEPVEGEVDSIPQEEVPIEGGGRGRRPLILAGTGIVLIGVLYLANMLFFSPASPVPAPVRQTVPAPAVPAPVPVPSPPSKEAAVAPAVPAAPSKPEAKPAPPAPTAPTAAKAAPGPPPDAKPVPSSAKPAPSAKATQEQTQPAKLTTPAPKPEAKVAGKTAPAPAGGFSVQVGAMAMEENADILKQKLDAMGFPAVVRKGAGFVNRHIVTVGDPTGKREAEEMARRLNVDGFPSQFITFEGKYTPQVGSFVNLDEAIDLARELQKKNYRPKITSKPTTTSLFQVRHGQYDTRAAAMKRGEELKAKGFNAWVVPN
jgi:cell division septation protein DedD